MTAQEAGFLLLTSKLGNPERKTLSTYQLRTLALRVRAMETPNADRELGLEDLMALGYPEPFARRILALLAEEDVLRQYAARGKRLGCVPISRIGTGYPGAIRERLGLDAPGCLWAKGDLQILGTPMVSLVGSRNIQDSNRDFAREVGRQAARQGYTLVSGNARGADTAAQNACLAAGGQVISIVADELAKHPLRERVLYVSEDGFDEPFSALRALSRNRCIHALPDMTFVAQCAYEAGGTWDGTVKNLRFGWSPVFAFADGSPAMAALGEMGAAAIGLEDLGSIGSLRPLVESFL